MLRTDAIFCFAFFDAQQRHQAENCGKSEREEELFSLLLFYIISLPALKGRSTKGMYILKAVCRWQRPVKMLWNYAGFIARDFQGGNCREIFKMKRDDKLYFSGRPAKMALFENWPLFCGFWKDPIHGLNISNCHDIFHVKKMREKQLEGTICDFAVPVDKAGKLSSHAFGSDDWIKMWDHPNLKVKMIKMKWENSELGLSIFRLLLRRVSTCLNQKHSFSTVLSL